ncbi:MAG: S1 RNA-binding domain-containing protein, partial [Oscillospiraceae bacterium]
EVGSIIEGKVTGITKFGAFIELPGGKTGMVHISEVAATYVKEIRDFITENQMVKVKILAITPEGKVNLSMKRAVEQPPRSAPPPRRVGPGADIEFGRGPGGPQSFEDMLNRFKLTSDDRMSDLKRNIDGKRGSGRKHTK